LAGLSIVGCTHLDPWHQNTRTPPSPSSAFVSPPVSVSELEQPQAARTNQTPLPLAECIRIALERNPATRSPWAAARSAAASVGQARSGYLPSATVSSEGKRGDPVELDNATDIGAQNTFDASFGVSYLLFDPGRSGRLSETEAQLRSLNFRHNTTLQDVALAVEEAYYGFLAAQALRDLARETVKQQEQHTALAEGRYKAGTVQKSDVLKAVTEKANAELAAVRGESAVRIGKGRLANAIGLRVTDSFDVAPVADPQYRDTMSGLAALLAEASTNRPELQTALAEIDARRAQIETVRAQDWPIVSVTGEYGWKDRDFVPDRDEWTAGIAVSLPLFTGFERTYSEMRAKADMEKAKAEGEMLLRNIELEVCTAYSQLIEARQAIVATQNLVADA